MKTKRLIALILTLVMAMSFATFANAGHFSDVPENHWAYESVEKMAEGGLIKGYGNGLFGLTDKFTISQMCQIICNAKGYATTIKNGYWAYDAIDYCLNTLKCLPNFGAINAATYEVPITRELAVYMIVNGLGVNNTTGMIRNISINDIPDWQEITFEYQDAVEDAYQNRMTVGVDAAGTFKPKNTLTRGEGATMLVRAGYTTAAVKSTGAVGAVSGAEAFEKIKQLGAWEDATSDLDREYAHPRTTIRFTDPKVGGVKVSYQSGTDFIMIIMTEKNTQYDKNGNFLDVNGNVISWPYNEETFEYYASTGYSYEARQFVKKIFACVVGSDDQMVYDSLHRVFDGTVHAYVGGNPSDVIWAGERAVRVENGTNGNMFIDFYKMGDKEGYLSEMNARRDGWAFDTQFTFGNREHSTIAYELNKW